MSIPRGPQPYVLEGYDLLQFIQHILDNHTAPSWCIVCSTKEAFVDRLQDGLATEQQNAGQPEVPVDHLRQILRSHPTMRLIAASHTLRLAFVPDVVHLRAFLASLANRHKDDGPLAQPSDSIIAILDVITIHKPTTSYSAQGFNRTFALAVELAFRHNSSLILCETSGNQAGAEDTDLEFQPLLPAVDDDRAATRQSNPWDDDIGIVDVRTKTFGPGSRGWRGRTVKIRQVAERWMIFRKVRP